MNQTQPSGFEGIAEKQRQILSFLSENDLATADEMVTELGHSRKDILSALKRLEMSSQVRYSQGKWSAIER